MANDMSISGAEGNVPVDPDAPAPTDRIANGSVEAGTTLVSKNGRYEAVLQRNGNLVVRDTTKTGAAGAKWDSGTGGDAEGGRLSVRRDGNVVIYDDDGKAEWSTATDHDEDDLGPRSYESRMEDNGNLTLFDVKVGMPLRVNGDRIARGDELSDAWSDTRALDYIAFHPDLMNRLGSDDERGRDHFSDHGRSKDRTITFDAAVYLAANEDLTEVFGADTEKAAEHWIDFGRYEGRPGAPGAEPDMPVPALVFADESGNGRGTVTMPHGDGEVAGERIEDIESYAVSGRGIVQLEDGRRFVVERTEGAPFPPTDRGAPLAWDIDDPMANILSTNQYLNSDDGRFQAKMQIDGNFVVYDMEAEGGPSAIWDTGTDGDAKFGGMFMQRDGNLVLYEESKLTTGSGGAE